MEQSKGMKLINNVEQAAEMCCVTCGKQDMKQVREEAARIGEEWEH